MTTIKRKWNYSFLVVLMTIFVSMAFFYFLYCCNNKYTSPKEKAIQGVLCIEDFSEENGLYYLSREWEYYAGVLLTPKELQQNREEYSCRYVSVGQNTSMNPNKGDDSLYGSGTYRLRISLPEKKHTYALLLNEIFSAYRLYINGELIAQVGNPDPENYEEKIQNRMFTFEAGAMAEIMIAVTDKSSASPGISYVPVFGEPFRVNIQRGISALVSGLIIMISLIAMLFSAYFFFSTKVKKAGLFSLVCFCIFGYCSYSLLHMYLALKVQPWYFIELLFYYGMFPLMILLLHNMLGAQNKWAYFMAAFTGVCTIAGVAGELLLPQMDSLKALEFFSNITEISKWITACFLIGYSFWVAKKQSYSFILAASVVYGCSLGADRIWSVYEPVSGGWFPEIGGGILACVFGISVWKSLADGYRKQMVYEEKSRQLEKILILEKDHLEIVNQKVEEMNRIRHDIRQHFRVMDTFLKQKKYEELHAYLEEFTQEYEKKDVSVSYCRNIAVDAIIHYYAGQFQSENIEFQCDMDIPEKTGISDVDFCRLFGNLLENAMEAVSLLEETEKRWVYCAARVRNQKLLIDVENTCKPSEFHEEEIISSTKHMGKGIGTMSVKNLAEKYGGYADFQMKNGVFQVHVFFTLKVSSSAQ